MDSRDIALQSVMPTVMVPRFTEMDELATPGSRLLQAANGTWLEVCRSWMYVRTKIANALPVSVPYGEIADELTLNFAFGKLPREMVAQFIEQARTRCPNECAAWVVWNQRTNQWKLMMLEETSVGPGHVNVNLPSLGEDEHLVLDLHSHGTTNAFFSRTDNKDDKGGVKIAGVVGNLNQTEVTTVFRLCANGLFLSLPSIIPQGKEGGV